MTCEKIKIRDEKTNLTCKVENLRLIRHDRIDYTGYEKLIEILQCSCCSAMWERVKEMDSNKILAHYYIAR